MNWRKVSLGLVGLLGLGVLIDAFPPTTPSIADKQSAGPPDRVSRAAFEARGVIWPLAVEKAKVGCLPGKRLILQVESKSYALNGTARGIDGLPDADAVLVVDRKLMDGLRKAGDTNAFEIRLSRAGLVEEAERLC